jgi:hypothetical protein
MATITVKVVPENDLTVFTVEGDLSADEILEYSSEHNDKTPTKLVLWDATKGSVGKIEINDFRRIAIGMKKHTENRAGGKTALVGKFDVDFGSARMYEAFADFEEIPITYKTFRSVDDAIKWLQS